MRASLFALTTAAIAIASANFAEAAEGEALKIDNGKFIVSSEVPYDQALAFKRDLEFLDKLPIQPEPQAQTLMEIPGALSAASMKAWLAERVRYFVSETFQEPAKVLLWNYPYEGDSPESSNSSMNSKLAQGKGELIMMNAGTMIYRQAKRRHVLAGIEIPGVGMVKVTSPRTGIVKIGGGLFQPMFEKRGLTDTSGKVYSIYHLGVFFHEARHSDGHGSEVGFPHRLCPLGHTYEGQWACDTVINGAYIVGALSLRSLAAACTDCNAVEKGVLKMTIIDSLTRLLKQSPKIDAEAMNSYQCGRAKRDKIALTTDQQAICTALENKTIEMEAAATHDPRPEGKREE